MPNQDNAQDGFYLKPFNIQRNLGPLPPRRRRNHNLGHNQNRRPNIRIHKEDRLNAG
ncbi:MAG: hypothetical protein ACKPKO_33060 [Candidatus Fonsibacter sp.]